MLRVAIAIVRAWTSFYTWRMSATLRQERRAEIESDLWEFQRDAGENHSLNVAAHVLLRFLLGIPDDVGWRVEHTTAESARARGTISVSAAGVGALLFVCALWIIGTDATRKRYGFAFDAPTVVLDQDRLTPLAAGIVATVGASMMPRLAAQAQLTTSGAGLPAFEAASITPNRSGSPLLRMVPQPGGRFAATNVTLGILIRNAYQMPPFRMSGGPDWIESDRFDVAAKAEGNPPQEQIRLMLQRLLAERFALRVHNETRQQPVFELIVARRDRRLGPQLRRTQADCAGVPVEAPGSPLPAGTPRCGYIGPEPGAVMSSGHVSMAFRGITMEGFARFLVGAVRRVVSDRTGLNGYFDGEFDSTIEFPPPPPPPGVPDPFDRQNFPTIFTVLQEQLGLKLDSKRGPVDVLVIDRAERPTPD
jgi:uncharacterized protein (TIGR03435 family)